MSSPKIQRALQHEALCVLYRNQQRTLGFTVLACFFVAYAVFPHVPGQLLVPWLLLAVAANGLRYMDVGRRQRAADFGQDPAADERRAGVSIFACASLLGLPIALYFPLLSPPVQYAVGLGAVALSAGAAGSFVTSRSAFLAYSMPLLGLTAVGHLRCAGFERTNCQVLLVLVILLYGVGIGVIHNRMRKTVLDSMQRRHEKETVLREKEALLIRLEMDNAELLADRDAFLIESLTDGLTGLANRRHFDKTLLRDWDRARRESMVLSCIMLDLDHFKPYNDRHGHGAGDAMLKAVADAIGASLNRGSDFAARYGGEEFVLLLPGTDLEGSILLAERIRGTIESLSFLPDSRITISAGVASLMPGVTENSASSLLDRADEALYQAKAQGRNRVVAHRGAPAPDGDLPDPCCT